MSRNAGSVGQPMLEGIDYREELRESPSQMEICVAIFANVLERNERGEPVNEKYAERRAAAWLHRYCTGELPPGEPDIEPWERPPPWWMPGMNADLDC
ncbi:hypothetical protein OG381_44290 [Streptomyces sp. NBC_00490]|uniref:DUF7677 family protein n=1 Tax=Streptomyces sp. NBC_00490 TaxID=2903657 RepID=UPI002E17E278